MATDTQKVLALAGREEERQIPRDYNCWGETVEPNCADVLRIYLQINERQVVVAGGYDLTPEACPPLYAAATAAVQLACGQPALVAYSVGKDQIAALLTDDGLLDRGHEHCALMAELSLKRAVVQYAQGKAEPPLPQ